jgi:YD repeat-containing protein
MNIYLLTTRLFACGTLVAVFGGPADGQQPTDASPQARPTTYDFADDGRIIAVQRPDDTVLRYEYSSADPADATAARRVVAMEVRKYDDQGFLRKPDAPGYRVDFEYDRNGNRTRSKSDSGETRFYYDPQNRLTQVKLDYPDYHKVVSYDYDHTGNVARKSVQSQGAQEFVIRYEYDGLNRLRAENVNGFPVQYVHDPNSTTLTRTMPGGVRSVFEHNASGQLDRIQHFASERPLASSEFQYDATGRPSLHTTTVGDRSESTKINFGESGRIDSLVRDDARYALSYDANGTLQSVSGPTGKVDIPRDAFGRTSQIGPAVMELDPSGRPASIAVGNEVHRFQYGPFGQLAEVQAPSGVVRNTFSAEGIYLGSRFADIKREVVPDLLSPAGYPLMKSGQGFTETQLSKDLTLQFHGREAVAQWRDPGGRPLCQMEFRPGSPALGTFQPGQVRNFPAPSVTDFPTHVPLPDGAPLADFARGQRTDALLELADELTDGAVGPISMLRDAHDIYQSYREYEHGVLQHDPLKAFDMLSTLAGGSLATAGVAPQFALARATMEVYRDWTMSAFEQSTRSFNQWSAQSHFDMYGMTGNLNELARGVHALAPPITFHQLKQWDGRDPLHLDNGGWSGSLSRDPFGQYNMQRSFDHTFSNLMGAPHVRIEEAITATKPWGFLGPSEETRRTVTMSSHTTKAIVETTYRHSVEADGRMFLYRGNQKIEVDPLFARPGESAERTIARFAEEHGYSRSLPPLLPNEALQNLGSDKFLPKGVKFDQPAQFFGQIGAIQGICFDGATKRLTLLGNGDPALPPVRLDDFETAVRVVYGHHPGDTNDPTFSLDPADPDNPAGDWLAAVYRPLFLERSHMGDAMCRGDWILKQYTFGVVAGYDGVILGKRLSSVPGYASYLERAKAEPKKFPVEPVQSRFWILPLEMKLEQQGNTLVFSRATMQVQTRRMELTDSGLQDSPDKRDPIAEDFAAHFTEHYDAFAREAPVLDEVREAAKVVAIVKWLKQQGVGVNDLSVDWKATTEKSAPAGKSPAIHSLSLTECVSLWGLGSRMIRMVGGVELSPVLVQVPGSKAPALDRPLTNALLGPEATSVGRVVVRAGAEQDRYVAASLPITAASREFSQSHPAYVYEGSTYAMDAQGRLHHAFDAVGNSCDYGFNQAGKLANVTCRDARNWELRGALNDDGGRELSLSTPKGDRFQYRFAKDGKLRDIHVNGNLSARTAWSEDGRSCKLEYVRAARKWGIGELAPKDVEQVAASEELQLEGNTVSREVKVGSGDAQRIILTMDNNTVTARGDGLPEMQFEFPDAKSVSLRGPGGRVQLQFRAEDGVLEEMVSDNGDFVRLNSRTEEQDGSTVVMEAKQGDARADVRISKDKDTATVTGFDGRMTVYRYGNDRLQSVTSDRGTTQFEYTDDGKRLRSLRFPDGTIQQFQWQDGLGVKRLRTWRESPKLQSPRKNVGLPDHRMIACCLDSRPVEARR